MHDFPRIQLLTPRELRAATVLALALAGLAAGAVAYMRPSAPRPAAAAPASSSAPVVDNLVLAVGSPTTAYVATFQTSFGPSRSRASFRTEDGGRTWERIRPPGAAGVAGLVPGAAPGEVGLYSFVRDALGTAAWVSHDAGRSWAAVKPPPEPRPGGGIQFVPHTSQAVFTSFGPSEISVYVSRDWRSTWQQAVGARPGLNDVPFGSFVEYAGGFLWILATPEGVTREAALYRSSPDGRDIDRIRLPVWPSPPPAGFSYQLPVFTSPGHGYMVVLAPNPGATLAYVSTTDDGGVTWTPVRPLQHFPVAAVPGGDEWWATDGLNVVRSHDRGLTWSSAPAALPKGERLQQVTPVSESVAWNLTTGGPRDAPHLLRTVDGGRHWSEVRIPT